MLNTKITTNNILKVVEKALTADIVVSCGLSLIGVNSTAANIAAKATAATVAYYETEKIIKENQN